MRKLLVVLVVLAALAVVGDRVAAGVAEDELARRASAEAGVPVAADIRGFPFLTQALGRSFSHVTLRADRYRVPQGLQVVDLDADLRDVDVTTPTRPVAGSVRLDGTIPFREVEARLGLAARSLSAVGSDRVRVARSVRVGGQVVAATAEARVTFVRGALVVAPTAAEVSGVPVDQSVVRDLASRLTVRYPVRGLPAGSTLQALGVTSTGFRVRVTGSGVELVR